MLDDRRPDRAGDVVAAGADRDRDAAPALEPERGVGDQRREARRAADQAEQDAVDDREGPDAAGQAGGDEADAEAGGADAERHDDAAPVGEAPHEDAADAEADHQQRVGQRRVGARDAELGLHARQDDGDDVHRAAADRHQHQGDGEAAPGVAGIDGVCLHGVDCAIRRGDASGSAAMPTRACHSERSEESRAAQAARSFASLRMTAARARYGRAAAATARTRSRSSARRARPRSAG